MPVGAPFHTTYCGLLKQPDNEKIAKVDYVEIKWPAPSGLVERFFDLPLDRYSMVVEGKGKRW